MELVYLFALFFASNFHSILSDNDQSTITTICDNGKVNIEVDLRPSIDLQCSGDRIVVSEYLQPAGKSSCVERDKQINGQPVCMNTPLSYDNTTIVTSGDYRPMAPQYGEYSYLPPQRWLHALKYGAVVFLYHPCAPIDQVMELKRLARSCLWKHIITPSNLVSMAEPFSIVSYGCHLSMRWVDLPEAERWVQHHALQTPESLFIQDGLYNHGLIEASYIVSTRNDSVICPDFANENQQEELDDMPSDSSHGNDTASTTPFLSTPTLNYTAGFNDGASNCSRGDDTFQCTTHNIVVILHHYPVLYGLVVIMGVVILTLVFFLFCLCLRKHGLLGNRSKKHVNGRYKPCGQFYIGGGGKEGVSNGIVIPELGLPKTIPSEREKLLIESDEDDL